MCVNEIWCSICCRYMDESCKKCSHFDEQVHLDQEDKVDTSPEHPPDADKGIGMITGENPAMMYFHVDISPMDGCKNLMESYGEICVRCNKCGRFGRGEE